MDSATVWNLIYSVIGVLVAVLVIGFLVSHIRQLRMPKERRYELVAAELRRREKPTGATSVARTFVAGVGDEDIRIIADQNGYDWVGYTHRNDAVLNFQRRIASNYEGEQQ